MAETKIEWCSIPRPGRFVARRPFSTDGGLAAEEDDVFRLEDPSVSARLLELGLVRPDMRPGYTFNPWWGCVEADGRGGDALSPACLNCYAAAFSRRVGWSGQGSKPELWGRDSPRRPATSSYWLEPEAWNAEATEAGEVRAVFCASMGDVAEDRRDLDEARGKLWDLIARTPALVWLLLTKRPLELGRMVPWSGRPWPDNVWFGVTVESAPYLSRVEEALREDAPVHFVSHEPALGDVDFAPVLGSRRGLVRWLIVGSESGSSARPVPLERAEGVVAQARAAGAAPFVKQLDGALLGLGRKGHAVKELDRLPAHLRVRDFPPLPPPPHPAQTSILQA